MYELGLQKYQPQEKNTNTFGLNNHFHIITCDTGIRYNEKQWRQHREVCRFKPSLGIISEQHNLVRREAYKVMSIFLLCNFFCP